MWLRLALLGLSDPKSWVSEVFTDIMLIRERFPGLCGSMPDPFEDPRSWIVAIRQAPRVWARLLSRVARDACHACSVDVHASPLQQSDHEVQEYACPECQKTFLSEAAMLTHCTNVHGYISPVRARVKGTVCECCGCQFHQRSRLLKHVKRKPSRCHQHYLECVPALDPAAIKELDRAAREERTSRNSFKAPVIRQCVRLGLTLA